MRVSHEFLLPSHGYSGLVQPRTIPVTERVKPDPAKSQFQPCRNQIVKDAIHVISLVRVGHFPLQGAGGHLRSSAWVSLIAFCGTKVSRLSMPILRRISCLLQKSCGRPKSLPVLTRPNALDWRILSPMCVSSRENGFLGRANPPCSMCC